MDQFHSRMKDRSAVIAVVGGGYVGLPAAMAFAKRGFKATVYDANQQVVDRINDGQPSHRGISPDQLRDVVDAGRLQASGDPAVLADADAILICVPTPLDRHREPDMSYVRQASQAVAKHLREGQAVSLESTTYPGTTRELVLPILENAGLTVGEEFALVYSPERIDPGNVSYGLENTPKVVGGITETCLQAGRALYGAITKETVAVSSTDVAEASKLLENIYRSVNIALVNELKLLFDRMDIDVWEVIGAASSKPFGFQAFYPGPGLGGHCIPIDPFYLTWKGREYGFTTKFIELAGEVNTAMPRYVASKVAEALNSQGKAIKGSTILLLGAAYKPNVGDTRESPTIALYELLEERSADVAFHDPYVPEVTLRDGRRVKRSGGRDLDAEQLIAADCVVVVTDHDAYDIDAIVEKSRLIVDTRNVVDIRLEKIFKA